jgi:RimJ/RimL family protein N-acetyltransferase
MNPPAQQPAGPPTLKGQRIALRPFEAGDAAFLRDISNDTEYQAAAFQGPSLPRNAVPFQSRLDQGHLAPLTGAYSAVELAITEISSPSPPIGVAGLYQIDWQNLQAEMGVSITDPGHRRSGLGLDANTTLLDYAFHHLSLHRIYGHVKADNEAPLRVCKRLGFSLEGTLREHRLRNGVWVDLCVLGLLRSEWIEAREQPASDHRS